MSKTDPVADKPALSAGVRLQFEKAQNGWVLLYPEGMVQLNQSAAEILRLCNGNRSQAEIVQELEALFDTSGIEAEVFNLLDEARRRAWVT